MNPRLEEIFAYAASTRDELLRAADAPDEERSRRPSDGRWSVAENLEHLALVEAGTVALLAKMLARARAAGLGPEREYGSVLHSLDQHGVEHAARPIVAPSIVAPTGTLAAEDSLASLARSRAALLAFYREANGLDLSAVRARHITLGELDLYQWPLFVAQHERRHARQIVATLAALRR